MATSDGESSRASIVRWLMSLGLAGAWIFGWCVPLSRQHEAELAKLPQCPPGSAAESDFFRVARNNLLGDRPPTCADDVAPLKKPIDEKYGNWTLVVVLTSPFFFALGRLIANDTIERRLIRAQQARSRAFDLQRQQEREDETEREASLRSALEEFDSRNRTENLRADVITRLGLVVEDIDILTELPPSAANDVQHQKDKINLQLSKMVSHSRTEEVMGFAASNAVAQGRLAHIRQRLQRLAMDNVDLSILMSQIKENKRRRGWWRR